MTWKRLYITVEGQAERAFASQVLVPHLAQFSIEVKPRLVVTNRNLGCRGGITNYSKIRNDLAMRLKEDHRPEAHLYEFTLRHRRQLSVDTGKSNKSFRIINYYWYFPQDHSDSGYGTRSDPQPPSVCGGPG